MTDDRLDQRSPDSTEFESATRWRILSVLAVGLFMSLVGVSIINVALPSIEKGLGASYSQLQWVLTSYTLTFGIFLVPAGRCGDIFGRGRLFIFGVLIFVLASLAAGISTDPLALNIARAAQGVGSGISSPQAIGMIQHHFRGTERGRAFGVWGSVVGMSMAAGPLLGGLLIELLGDDLGWRATFFLNVPLGAIAICLAILWFPDVRRARSERSAAKVEYLQILRDIDAIGALLLGLSVFAVLIPFAEYRTDQRAWVSIPFAIALVFAWMRWEARYKRSGRAPMVDFEIFRTRSYTNGVAMIGAYFTGMTSVWVLIAIYFQDGRGHTALETGLLGLPSFIAAALAAAWAGRNVARYGRKIVVVGLYIAIAGLGLSGAVVLLVEVTGVSEWWLLLTLTLLGVTQGTVISPNQTLTLADVPLSYAGSSAGLMQTGQRIGSSIGVAAITALAFAIQDDGTWGVGVAVGFSAITATVAIALVIAHADMRVRSRTSAAPLAVPVPGLD